MAEIIKLADKDDRASTWTVEDMLKKALEGIREDPQYSKKAIILFLDEEDQGYNIRTMAAGFTKTSEIVCLLDVEKTEQKKEMGH